ncbi:maleylpyruvate isomerase family mycothiol-dependent enzyme [Saccharothrix isguenensis]
MELALTDQRWRELRDALADVSHRFDRLLRDCRTPDLRAVGNWSVAETAAHTAIVARLNAALIADDPSPLGYPELDRLAGESSFADFGRLNDTALDHYPDHSTEASANRHRDQVDLLLARADDVDPHELRPWLGSARLPAATLVAHQLNETMIHGLDIARALDVPWPIPTRYAALSFDVFLMQLLGGDSGRLLTGGPPGRGGAPGRVVIGFRSKHTTPVVLTRDDGRLSIDPPDGGKVDATVRFDPTAMMLTIFRRTRLARAVVTGKVFASGRRPWAAVGYLRGMRSP